MSDDGRSTFINGYVLSPIVLTGGIAANMPGGLLPIINLTQSGDYQNGVLSASSGDTGYDDYFAHYDVPAGATLIDNQYGMYPFANQSVAANALISQPLQVSLIMYCPVRQAGDYSAKTNVMTALQSSLYQHCGSGGTFAVATPAFFYTDMLLRSLKDISAGESKQRQWAWQWDFFQPLLTQAEAQLAQNSLMTKISNATPVAGDPPNYSGQSPAVGNPASGQGPATVPAARSLQAASGAGGQSPISGSGTDPSSAG